MRIAAITFLVMLPIVARGQTRIELEIWSAGRPIGVVRSGGAMERGVVVIELGDAWVPPAIEGTPYEGIYAALAGEHFADAGAEWGTP